MIKMETKMSQMEFNAKQKKLKEEEKKLSRLFFERGISINYSGTDGENFISDPTIVIDSQILVQQSTIKTLRQELDTAKIVEVKESKAEDGKLKVGYGSRVKIRYYFSEDDIEDEYITICNVGTSGTYGVVCTPASLLYSFIEGKVAGYHGTFKGSTSQNTTLEYDFEILEVLPPDPILMQNK
jgi:hypothetical protein